MGLTFNFTAGQDVHFTTFAGINNITKIGLAAWVDLNAYHGGLSLDILCKDGREASTKAGWRFSLFNGTTAKTIRFSAGFSGSNGSWDSGANSVLEGRHHIFILYDRSNVANSPKILVDTASCTVGGTQPTGTAGNDSAQNLYVGNRNDGTHASFDGSIDTTAIYDLSSTTLTDANILAWVADGVVSRQAVITLPGIVFSPLLIGASGGVVDGSALGTDNKITDMFSGSRGTPAGDPVLHADNYLIFGD